MITAAILTVSDSAFQGKREDQSGPALKRRCEVLGWEVVVTAIVPDEIPAISSRLTQWADDGMATLILTTGGTGISARDNTIEATQPLLERELPGVGELMRSKGLEQTPFAVLSRGLAGTRKRAFIVNLPGAPAGALHSLRAIELLVPHVLKILAGNTEHGSREHNS